jgi:predicted porin
VAWSATPALTLKAALTHDKGTDLNGVAGRDGSKVTTVASAEYALSKRSSLYAALFSNRFADGYELDPVNIAALGRDPAASSTNGFSLGVRHDF